MNFTEYMDAWVKSEVTQGRTMIFIGFICCIAVYFIYKNSNELLNGSLFPLGLLILILMGYGAYIVYSRPVHARESISLYEHSPSKAIEAEIKKHIDDNKLGKTLLKWVYPIGIIGGGLLLFLIPSVYYRGMAIGFILVFLSTYIIDYGFISRSDNFISFLKDLS